MAHITLCGCGRAGVVHMLGMTVHYHTSIAIKLIGQEGFAAVLTNCASHLWVTDMPTGTTFQSQVDCLGKLVCEVSS